MISTTFSVTLPDVLPSSGVNRSIPRSSSGRAGPFERGNELGAAVHQPLARAAPVRGADRIFAEHRERNGRIAVGNHRVREHAGIHLAPSHGLGGGCAREAAPDDLIRRDLDEVVVASLGNTVHLPERRLPLQVEVLRRASSQDDAAVLLRGQDDRADLVHVPARIEHEGTLLEQLVRGDVHADRAVAGRRGVNGHAEFRGGGDDRIRGATGPRLEQVPAKRLVQLGRRHRPFHAAADEKIADERVGVEQHLRRKQDVVDADHAFLVEHAIVEERRAAAQREVQRVVQIVIEVRAGTDDEIDEAALHHRDDAAAQARRRHRPRDGQRNGGVVPCRQHLVAEDAACLAKARGVERLEAVVDQRAHGCTAFRPVITNWLTFEERLGTLGGAGRAIRHRFRVAS